VESREDPAPPRYGKKTKKMENKEKEYKSRIPRREEEKCRKISCEEKEKGDGFHSLFANLADSK